MWAKALKMTLKAQTCVKLNFTSTTSLSLNGLKRKKLNKMFNVKWDESFCVYLNYSLSLPV